MYRQSNSAPSGSDLPCAGNPRYDYCYVGNLYWGRDHADDEGIIKTAPRALKAKIFPADNMSVEKIENALFKMRELGLIIFNEDATLCRFVNWFEFQKI